MTGKIDGAEELCAAARCRVGASRKPRGELWRLYGPLFPGDFSWALYGSVGYLRF